jgi:hypothetical protein
MKRKKNLQTLRLNTQHTFNFMNNSFVGKVKTISLSTSENQQKMEKKLSMQIFPSIPLFTFFYHPTIKQENYSIFLWHHFLRTAMNVHEMRGRHVAVNNCFIKHSCWQSVMKALTLIFYSLSRVLNILGPVCQFNFNCSLNCSLNCSFNR